MDTPDKDLLIAAYKKEAESLRMEVAKLRKVLQDNDLLDEANLEKALSPEEEICVKGIEQILDLVRNKTFDKNDIANYDILHKNLRMIRNQPTENSKKQKPTNVKELLKIVEGG